MEFAPAIVAKLRERAEKYRKLTERLSSDEFGTDGKRMAEAARERGQLEESAELAARVESFLERKREAESILADSRPDPDLLGLAREDLEALEEEFPELDGVIKAALVTDEDDHRDKVIFEIRAGAGGDEASLFTADLFRMYVKFIEAKGWRYEVLEQNASDVGGFKDVIFAVRGEGCWRGLRFESGGHRVQRVPATETQGRIHTSAATVAVLPEPEAVDVVVKEDDLRVDTFSSGGPGGQSVNRTASAVRLTHLPTGTVVSCQDEKSQHKNKAKAMRILRSRLFEDARRKHHEARAEMRRTQVGSGDRSDRVRTYNYPQNRVSDHRLGPNFSLEQVIGGRLDPILAALVELDREERIKNL